MTNFMLHVPITSDEANDVEAAASDAIHLLGHAGAIFDLLSAGFSSGRFDPEEPGMVGLLEMLGRGYRAAADKEGETLYRLGAKLRSMKQARNADQS